MSVLLLTRPSGLTAGRGVQLNDFSETATVNSLIE